jgi:hypothetical protein
MRQIDRLTEATLNTARLQGCTCQPDVQIAGSGGFYSALVAHDEWCSLAPGQRAQKPPAVILPSKAGEARV